MKFEIVTKYKDANLSLPVRATAHAAGYDFCAAEDIVIPSYQDWMFPLDHKTMSLDEMADYTKKNKLRPTLIPTGIKCQLDDNMYLELVNRSSSPLKYLLIQANAPGVIDADYYNNPDNEGEIFFQVLNFSPYSLQIKKGDRICQGIIHQYYTTKDDKADGERVGGFGSTNEQSIGLRPSE